MRKRCRNCIKYDINVKEMIKIYDQAKTFYNQEPFIYCPWCGNELEHVPSELAEENNCISDFIATAECAKCGNLGAYDVGGGFFCWNHINNYLKVEIIRRTLLTAISDFMVLYCSDFAGQDEVDATRQRIQKRQSTLGYASDLSDLVNELSELNPYNREDNHAKILSKLRRL